MFSELRVWASQRLAGDQVLSLERIAIGRQDKLGLGRDGLGAFPESAQRVPHTPGKATAMWMLLRCRTPPTSEALVSPFRKRAIVASFMPNAVRKA